MQYLPYHEDWTCPNIVVDSGPRAGTIVTLSHWPSVPTPRVYAASTSSESVIKYISAKAENRDAFIATASHFDVDAVVGLYALLNPAVAAADPATLIALAEAGDFCVAKSANIRRISVAMGLWADPKYSPISAELAGTKREIQCSVAIRNLLPRMKSLIEDPLLSKQLWQSHEKRYWATAEFLASGDVTISNDDQVDLSVVLSRRRPQELYDPDAHYYGLDSFALHESARCGTIALLLNGNYNVSQRYEGWVQFASERTRSRRDLAPASAWLSSRDAHRWLYAGVQYPYPSLTSNGRHRSLIDPDEFVSFLTSYLASAPPAWKPDEIGYAN